MCRAPFTTVLLAALFGAVTPLHAHKVVTSTSTAPPPVVSITSPLASEHLGTALPVRSSTALTTEKDSQLPQIIASAYQGHDRIAPSVANPSHSPMTRDDSGWRYTAALLGTLGIIATIAVRRRKAGKPWA